MYEEPNKLRLKSKKIKDFMKISKLAADISLVLSLASRNENLVIALE